MKIDPKVAIKDYTNELDIMYAQRRKWLFFSSLVFTFILGLIVSWQYLESLDNAVIWWGVISGSLILSVNWWYWTMHSIGKLLRSIYAEYQLLNDIIIDISEIKEIIKVEKEAHKRMIDNKYK